MAGSSSSNPVSPVSKSIRSVEPGFSEHQELESLLIHPRQTWKRTRTKVHLYNKLHCLSLLWKVLEKAGEMADFQATCFGCYSALRVDGCFPSNVFHCLLLRRINEPSAHSDDIWFAMCNTRARLSRREFAMVTGLRFGKLNEMCTGGKPKIGKHNIKARFWSADTKVERDDLIHLLERRLSTDAQDMGMIPGDALKLCLLYFAQYFLLGRDKGVGIPNWMFCLVDDMSQWNDFAWGHYCWSLLTQNIAGSFSPTENNYDKKTKKWFIGYHMYGFPWAVVVRFVFFSFSDV